MRLIRTVFFTDNGRNLIEKLSVSDSDLLMDVKPEGISLSDWTKESFELHLPILFIGSVGIAVRAIAPFVSDKLKDSAVIVVDELGKNVVPILSGHYGGANELARDIAEIIDANPVITTATDINNVFAVDVFAKKNGLWISDKSKIKEVSSKALKGEKLHVEQRDEVITIENLELIPKRLVLGMGCKKGKSFESLKEFILSNYEAKYLQENLYAICSIDLKAREIGLIKLSQYFGVPFITFSAEELKAVEGDFTESNFVDETVGVGNVCERAAICGAGENSKLLKHKIANDGMTLAAARREKIVLDW